MGERDTDPAPHSPKASPQGIVQPARRRGSAAAGTAAALGGSGPLTGGGGGGGGGVRFRRRGRRSGCRSPGFVFRRGCIHAGHFSFSFRGVGGSGVDGVGGGGGVAVGRSLFYEAAAGVLEELERAGARDAWRDGFEVVEDAHGRWEQGEGVLEPTGKGNQRHGCGVGEAAGKDARLRRVEEDVRAVADGRRGGGGGAHRKGPWKVIATDGIEDLFFGLQIIEGNGLLVDLVCEFPNAAQEWLDNAPELSLDREKWSLSVQCRDFVLYNIECA